MSSYLGMGFKQEFDDSEDVKPNTEGYIFSSLSSSTKCETVKEMDNVDSLEYKEGQGYEDCDKTTIKIEKLVDQAGCDDGQMESNVTELMTCNIKKEELKYDVVEVEYDAATIEGCEENSTHASILEAERSDGYRCNLCEYKTKWKYAFNRHFKRRHDENIELFCCPSCEFRTKCKSYLRSHIKSTHDENFEWQQCPYCQFQTKARFSLLSHITRMHDERSEWHHCSFCNFKTNFEANLKAHFRKRHDENVECYQCLHCRFRTKVKGDLVVHFRRKHNENPEWHQCQHCQYRTKVECDLKRHLRRHGQGELQCRFCEFKTNFKQNLTRHHKRKHSQNVKEEHQEEIHFSSNTSD